MKTKKTIQESMKQNGGFWKGRQSWQPLAKLVKRQRRPKLIKLGMKRGILWHWNPETY
jgi:hypothetical protein